MKSAWRILAGITLVFAVVWFLLPADHNRLIPRGQRSIAGGPSPTESQRAVPNQQGPIVSEPVEPGSSPPVRDLPVIQEIDPPLDRDINPRQNPLLLQQDPGNYDPADQQRDPLLDGGLQNLGRTPSASLSFDGLTYNGSNPPDTVGEVGPNHYVQMVNLRFAIFNKNGTLLTGPTAFSQLFMGEGGQCEIQNAGDPIVVYDRLADRWLLSQFARPNHICIAVSKTPDPTGAFHLYEFNVSSFPDYFKIGVWPDAYYMAANEGSYTAYAFDRPKMLTGVAATFHKFTGQSNLLLPSDFDGPTPPPTNAPNYFYTFKDNNFHGGTDRLEIFELKADFATPANSSFTLVTSIPVAAFNYTVCGFFNFGCIPQNGGSAVDAVSEWPMWRLQYRNFGTFETLVGNFTIDVTGGDRAGIRWFELRKSGGGGWTLFQEGTHSPDATHRWMGSIAMDQAGNIALGYSASSATSKPSIRYATRLASDPPSTLQSEVTLLAGGGSQFFSSRWGDYSSMNVDPADDCTFWYTNEYYLTDFSTWRTRVGKFVVFPCGFSITKSASPAAVITGQPLTYTIRVTNSQITTATHVIITDTVPANTILNTASLSGNVTTSGTTPGSIITWTTGISLSQNQSLTRTFVVTVNIGVSNGTVVTNTALLSATNLPVSLSSSAHSIVAAPDLTTTLVSDPGSILTTTTTSSYTIALNNNGDAAATGVTLTNTIPVSTTYIPGSASHGGLESGGTISWTVASVNAGTFITRSFRVSVTQPLVDGDRLVNEISVDSAEGIGLQNVLYIQIVGLKIYRLPIILKNN